jgi:hypothetical protein
MFKYCVWYLVKETHPIRSAMTSYASLLNTPLCPPHITIQSGLSKKEAVEVYERFKEHEKPFFSPSGWAAVTETKFSSSVRSKDLTFYAIEQPLNTNGVFVEGIHISLAYSINRPFTPMEVAMSPYIQRLYPTDIDVVVADCSDENPEKWRILENHTWSK